MREMKLVHIRKGKGQYVEHGRKGKGASDDAAADDNLTLSACLCLLSAIPLGTYIQQMPDFSGLKSEFSRTGLMQNK